MSDKSPWWRLIGILIFAALLVGLILMIPVNTIESFESAYQVPVQEEKTEVVISQTFQLQVATFWEGQLKEPPTYSYYESKRWEPRHQNEWVTGAFTANGTLREFIIMDGKNYGDWLDNAFEGTHRSIHSEYSEDFVISDNFTFKPRKIDNYFFIFHDSSGAKIISFELTSHWHETEYEIRYKTEYKEVNKPFYEVLLSRFD